jgi:hypothetical protein
VGCAQAIVRLRWVRRPPGGAIPITAAALAGGIAPLLIAMLAIKTLCANPTNRPRSRIGKAKHS